MDNLKSFIIFITIVLIVYGGINFYLFQRITMAASITGNRIWILRIILIILILSYPLGRIIGSGNSIGISFHVIGSFWLGMMTYFFLIALAVDFMRLTNFLLHWIPPSITSNPSQAGRIILNTSTLIVFTAVILGYFNALHPVVKEVKVKFPRFAEKSFDYHIAVFSDAHLGTLVGKKRLNYIVDKVNSINPNLILIIGDLFDESRGNIEWALEPLSRLQAKDGIFAVSGNHEYYHGISQSAEFMNRAGIKMLRNETIQIEGVINLAGCDDVTGLQQFGEEKAAYSELMGGAEGNLPTILMHHTPLRIEEARRAGVDMMLCGHTHSGQLWPFGYITKWIYGIAPGLSKRGDMLIYLTSGAGTWGPPVRIGAKPELVHIILE